LGSRTGPYQSSKKEPIRSRAKIYNPVGKEQTRGPCRKALQRGHALGRNDDILWHSKAAPSGRKEISSFDVKGRGGKPGSGRRLDNKNIFNPAKPGGEKKVRPERTVQLKQAVLLHRWTRAEPNTTSRSWRIDVAAKRVRRDRPIEGKKVELLSTPNKRR